MSITINGLLGGLMPECFRAAPDLRWFQPTHPPGADGSPLAPVLQQAWLGDRGTLRWEDVPTEVQQHGA